MDIANMSVEELLQLQDTLVRLEDATKKSGTDKWFVEGGPFSIENYPKHRVFFDLGKIYRERVLMAANRCGKSLSGALEVSCHMTGRYPSWWNGKRYDHPTNWWAAGKDKTTTRDTIQKELFGELGAFGTGMFREEDIFKTWSMQGVPNGIEVALIKHVSGGYSKLTIKSYDRGVDSFMGTAMHGIWLDEECPEDVYGECVLRTMTTKGIILTTFTPKKGLTPLLMTLGGSADFYGGDPYVEPDDTTTGDAGRSRAIVRAGWADVPHLDEQAKREILAATPQHLKNAVMNGDPTIGEGLVYPVERIKIQVDPFPIPKHYKRWYGMDVGWNVTACVFFAQDPDSGQMYITHEYRGERAEPIIHAEAIKKLGGEWMTGAVDPASNISNAKDGQKLFNIYRQHGLQLVNADNDIESGIRKFWEALSTGKLKIFATCTGFFREFALYKIEKGKIKKENDHELDAARYGFLASAIGKSEKEAANSAGSGFSYSMRTPF